MNSLFQIALIQFETCKFVKQKRAARVDAYSGYAWLGRREPIQAFINHKFKCIDDHDQ